TKEDATWSTSIRLCAASADQPPKSCGEGKTCVFQPEAPFQEQSICFAKDGDVSCPEGSPYTTRQVAYKHLSDTRGCSSCACDKPSGNCLCDNDNKDCATPHNEGFVHTEVYGSNNCSDHGIYSAGTRVNACLPGDALDLGAHSVHYGSTPN